MEGALQLTINFLVNVYTDTGIDHAGCAKEDFGIIRIVIRIPCIVGTVVCCVRDVQLVEQVESMYKQLNICAFHIHRQIVGSVEIQYGIIRHFPGLNTVRGALAVKGIKIRVMIAVMSQNELSKETLERIHCSHQGKRCLRLVTHH